VDLDSLFGNPIFNGRSLGPRGRSRATRCQTAAEYTLRWGWTVALTGSGGGSGAGTVELPPGSGPTELRDAWLRRPGAELRLRTGLRFDALDVPETVGYQALVAAERARIARELHDVVAHNVSVMVVQADGAAYVLDAAPDQAKQALSTISTTGRQALAEMRRLLGLLRAGDDAGGEYVPQPGVDQLADLIDQVRGAGLPVRFEVAGDARPLSSGVELTAYRIVQEALTNVRKHGGDGASASVLLGFGEAALDLLIEDDGRGGRDDLYEQGGRDGLGQGLIGMRERIGMVGGTLNAGPRPGGGFRISAMLPLLTGS